MQRNLSILERLREYSFDGYSDTVLNLYPRQEAELLKNGFALQRLRPVSGYPDQNVVRIDWSGAMPGTFAHTLLQESKQRIQLITDTSPM